MCGVRGSRSRLTAVLWEGGRWEAGGRREWTDNKDRKILTTLLV